MPAPAPFPTPGAKALALLGPDYAPGQRLEVEIIAKAMFGAIPDSWICRDANGNLLTLRTRKLVPLDGPPPSP